MFNQWCDLTGSCHLAPAPVSLRVCLFPALCSVTSWWGGSLKLAIGKYFAVEFANATSQGFFPPGELIVKHIPAQRWFWL